MQGWGNVRESSSCALEQGTLMKRTPPKEVTNKTPEEIHSHRQKPKGDLKLFFLYEGVKKNCTAWSSMLPNVATGQLVQPPNLLAEFSGRDHDLRDGSPSLYAIWPPKLTLPTSFWIDSTSRHRVHAGCKC